MLLWDGRWCCCPNAQQAGATTQTQSYYQDYTQIQDSMLSTCTLMLLLCRMRPQGSFTIQVCNAVLRPFPLPHPKRPTSLNPKSVLGMLEAKRRACQRTSVCRKSRVSKESRWPSPAAQFPLPALHYATFSSHCHQPWNSAQTPTQSGI